MVCVIFKEKGSALYAVPIDGVVFSQPIVRMCGSLLLGQPSADDFLHEVQQREWFVKNLNCLYSNTQVCFIHMFGLVVVTGFLINVV